MRKKMAINLWNVTLNPGQSFTFAMYGFLTTDKPQMDAYVTNLPPPFEGQGPGSPLTYGDFASSLMVDGNLQYSMLVTNTANYVVQVTLRWWVP
jgi:hypothetical protein